MGILSIQSAVAYGHVGNSAAVFALQRLGCEVWPINTVRYSNHPGHRGFRGTVTAPDEIATLVMGLAEGGWLRDAAAILTGYMGSADQGPAILEAVARTKDANPASLWALDPVIGDNGRIFVSAGIPEFMRDEAAPRADLLTPNAFELEFLSGRKFTEHADALAAARALVERGERPEGRLVVATGLKLADTGADRLTTLAVTAIGAWHIVTPRIDHPAYGAGDTFAALFTGHYLATRDVAASLGRTVSAVHAIIERSFEAGAAELLLVAAQDALVGPPRFAAVRLD